MRLATIAIILMVAASCDKARELAGGSSRVQTAEAADAELLDLTRKPDILFQVFGERDDPRMIPVAAIEGGALKQIVLTAAGWKQFDAIYTRSGATYTLYRGGRSIGTVFVRQGMWEKPKAPLYNLPNCELLTPLASVTLESSAKIGFTVEFLASGARLGRGAARPPMSDGEAETIARGVARSAASGAGIAPSALDRLAFKGTAVAAGVSAAPTVVGAFLDARGDERGASEGTTTHVFVVADRVESGAYQATYVHAASGSASSTEYRRYVDHLDVDRDGMDELVLEGWRFGGETFLAVLRHQSGRWVEAFRSRPSWCLDR